MLQTNPKDFVALLEVFSIGLTNKIVSTRQVIDWADAIIQQDAEPDDFIIELAMSGSQSINDLISLINVYVGDAIPSVAGRATLGLLYHEYIAGKIDLYRVVRTIDWLVRHRDFTAEEHGFMCGVDDEYAMAAEGIYGSVAGVADYVLRFLNFYQAFHLANMKEWDEINESVPGKMLALYNQLKIS
ncbi:hypothetical protein [Hymenobacter negativus]|uniref:Uncharacterized protein n=1 Tax=Hymenobacter negativus TaxID=2795026 RepID=A0ABS3Q895_9BACT|nr:hypothetical protein [Hymenobacter negativus]MBO2007454.1 hypothetical protein [Hymenobacter negativus]